MAMVDSVTVSMAADTIGTFNLILRENMVDRLTLRGNTSEYAGTNNTSSNVKPSNTILSVRNDINGVLKNLPKIQKKLLRGEIFFEMPEVKYVVLYYTIKIQIAKYCKKYQIFSKKKSKNIIFDLWIFFIRKSIPSCFLTFYSLFLLFVFSSED